MQDELSDQFKDQLITLESKDGQAYTCRVLGVFKYGGKDYALLLNTTGLGSTVVMELIEKDGGAVFHTIEDDKLFDEVLAFVKQELTEIAGQETDET